jgi:hypothetical protein
MDKSIDYTEMCATAEEIQALYAGADKDQFNNGFFLIGNKQTELDIEEIGNFEPGNDRHHCIHNHSCDFTDEVEIHVWLPRVDQLFDIWSVMWKHSEVSKDVKPREFVRDLDLFMGDTNLRISKAGLENPYITMERWVLAFVMDRVFTKRWSKETKQWIKL